MTETTTPTPANDAPRPQKFDSSSEGLHKAAAEFSADLEDDTVEEVPAPKGDEPLTFKEGAEALTKYRREREADRKALEDAIGLNASEDEADPAQDEPSLPTEEKLKA